MEAENGKLIVKRSQIQTTIEQGNMVLLNNFHKDSTTSEQMEVKEKNTLKEVQKERKGVNGLWLGLLAGGLLIWIIMKFFSNFKKNTEPYT